MANPKGMLFKVKLLEDTAYNDKGQKLNIMQVDDEENIYYYDSYKRWCYLTAAGEDKIWQRI